MNRNVLAIGVSREEFDRVTPFLLRQSFEVDRFPSAEGAVELISNVAFEMLLVRYPLPDMRMRSFLSEVRHDGSPCRSASLIILTEDEQLTEADRFIGLGANRTVDIDGSEEEIQESISSVLHVAPRKAARFLARMEVKIGDAKDMILCQTENISTSGMLMRTDRRYDIGTQFEFEFSVSDDPRPVRGVAEVMRHTLHGKDEVGGVGVRFLSFSGDAQRRFEAFLRRLD